jgi:probable rRNA maturation factor
MPRRRLAGTARRLAKSKKVMPGQTVNVILCSNYTIRRLNKAYRHTDRVTDVLAFSFNDKDLLGEIYISAQRAFVQARRYGLSYSREIERLFVHGFFHLLGFDHQTKAQRERMQAYERLYCCLGKA